MGVPGLIAVAMGAMCLRKLKSRKGDSYISFFSYIHSKFFIHVNQFFNDEIKILLVDNKIKNRDMSIFGALRCRISAKNGEISKKETEFTLYSFESISNATNCFFLANKLGEGGFGPVYKVIHHILILLRIVMLNRSCRSMLIVTGMCLWVNSQGKLEEGQEIAVKRLSRTSGQGLKSSRTKLC